MSNVMVSHCNIKDNISEPIQLTAVMYHILMQLLNIYGLFQMRSYRPGAVEAAMTHRMTKIAFG